MRRTTPFLALILLVAAGPVPAQAWEVRTEDPWCDAGDGSRYCEVRALTIPAPSGALRVDPGMNGGIHVEGESRGDVAVEVKIEIRERGRAAASELASRIAIRAEGGELRVEGPEEEDSGWSASFRLRVPHHSDLDLETYNGGIRMTDVAGRIRFEALNGGVHLEGLAGDVRGQTMNGGLRVVLSGRGWDGEGLDVRTTNGGVKLELPEGYNAELRTGTVNGRLRIEVPLGARVEELEERGKRVRTTLGSGGAPISVVTTNGGVTITR